MVMHLPAVASFLAFTASIISAYNIDVQVGPNGQLVYSPSYVYADPGDVINFKFNPKNHTLTESSFDNPCMRVAYGEDSGFKPVSADSWDNLSFQVEVKSKDPRWFYCRQTVPVSHCNAGMVFAINPTAEKSFQAFLNAAKAAGKTSTTYTTYWQSSSDWHQSTPTGDWHGDSDSGSDSGWHRRNSDEGWSNSHSDDHKWENTPTNDYKWKSTPTDDYKWKSTPTPTNDYKWETTYTDDWRKSTPTNDYKWKNTPTEDKWQSTTTTDNWWKRAPTPRYRRDPGSW